MKAVCIYCGSTPGNAPEYARAARDMAQILVEHNLQLVYGGGHVGLMGILADEVLRLGGEVTGVIPQLLMDREVGHLGLTRLHIVKDMHERKAMMADLSDAFIALPGGIGTLEELFEMLTWHQIGFHSKPVGLLNVSGFYDGLLAFLDHQVQQGFLKPAHQSLLLHAGNAHELLNLMHQCLPA